MVDRECTLIENRQPTGSGRTMDVLQNGKYITVFLNYIKTSEKSRNKVII